MATVLPESTAANTAVRQGGNSPYGAVGKQLLDKHEQAMKDVGL
jgi:hypothetical protein